MPRQFLMSTATPDLTIIIPALNEQENLKLLLPQIKEVLGGLTITSETIVVDGGSRDQTQTVSEQAGARVVKQTERGYGGALIAGFAAANSPYLVTMDADLSHPPVFLNDFWQRRNEAELLIASRYVPGGRADMGKPRRVLSYILNRTYSRLLNLKLRDVSSGFRMYDRKVLDNLNLRARDFDVLEEILVKIYVSGGRIKEVPFYYQARNSGKSHAKLVRFGWAFSKTLLRMWRLRYSK